MDLQTFRALRESREKENKTRREICRACRQPQFGCYCLDLKSFDPKIKFVILIHPIEVKRRIATGRMSHLCLENSELISGQDFSWNSRVNELIRHPEFHSLVLYPGNASLNLSHSPPDQISKLFPQGKRTVIFVIDGTWSTARGMMRQSGNLMRLPRICFSPASPSRFRVRKQPAPECYSTIEAIHQTIELVGPFAGFDTESRQQDHLLFVFDKMVHRQLSFLEEARANPNSNFYRRPRY